MTEETAKLARHMKVVDAVIEEPDRQCYASPGRPRVQSLGAGGGRHQGGGL
jgi:hypothetical protein